jgi:hypothetical protein
LVPLKNSKNITKKQLTKHLIKNKNFLGTNPVEIEATICQYC